MELKYITYSELLCRELTHIGFKRKKRDEFVKKYNGFIQMINFCHSSRIPGCREYYIIAGLAYPELEKMGMDLGVYTAGAWGMNIGYFTPQNSFIEWHVENSASEDDVREVVNDMVNLIKTYAVPFLDKYSDINEILFELEEGTKLVPHHSDYNLPLLYFMIGEKDNAISYMNKELKRKELKAFHNEYPIEIQNRIDSHNPAIVREYKEYKDFSSKLLTRMGQ